MTDRLDEIKTKWNIDPFISGSTLPWGKGDVVWLVAEVERLRECACAGCLSADADPRMHTCEDGHVMDTLAKLRVENLSLREEMDVMRRTHKAEVERLHTVNAMLVGGTVTAPDSIYRPPLDGPVLYTRQQVEAMLRTALTDRTPEWTIKAVDERVEILLAMFTLPMKETP